LINDIKSKLPFGKKGEEIDENEEVENETEESTDPALSALDKTGATDIGELEDDLDEDSDEDDTPVSIVDKIKAKFARKKKDSDSDHTEIGDKKKPKAKINPIVLVVILAALGIWVFYEEEPEVVQAPPPIKKIVKVPKEDRVVEKPADEAAEPKTEEPVIEGPTVDQEPVIEEPVVAETPAESVGEEPAKDEPVGEEPAKDEPVDEEPAIDEPVITNLSSESPDSPTDIAPTSFDSVDGQVTDVDDSTMTDKILEDLERQVKKEQPALVNKEYVAPPDYEYRGRGLVYNCAGKHWACVDGPSYKVCENNFSGSTYQKKTIECFPFNTYETKKGCELMQNRVVSSSAKTDFCKGN
jgi:hypothetical protein